MEKNQYGGSLINEENTPSTFIPIYFINHYGDCVIGCPRCPGTSGRTMHITHDHTCINRQKSPNLTNREQKCVIAREEERVRLEEERRRTEERRRLNEEQRNRPPEARGGYIKKQKRKTRINRKKNRKTRRR